MSEGQVILLSRRRGVEKMGHDYLSRAHAAARLADLLGYAYAGDYRERRFAAGHAYFVPDDTLHADDAVRIGVLSDRDLFGGVAPHAFVATKALTHGTVSAEAHAPAGWVPALAAQLEDAVLYGFTAFARGDARLAARRVLQRGRARLKRAVGTGGAGQTVVADIDEFDAALAAVDDAELQACGVVVEQNLEEAVTYSIGHLQVGGRRIAYYGTQHTVRNHHGHDVYGGSELVVMRDGAGPPERADMSAALRAALTRAQRYEAAVVRAFPRFFASRHNYDVACGRDADDGMHIGVLEQSWRFGGASPAEIAALHAFERDPGLHRVRASTHEIYDDVEPPRGAIVSFRGDDPNAGRMTKYSLVDAHGHPA
ncbi:DUF3182 family protein [Dokdonella sp.]|uniref:DUF3182 family protein n=1 Tax=Dokdonella sp. TaxID=2291710 RepID=UPI001AFE2823|nr:DUF3182 family protein [Dokdonella sp.]MBO9662872.1 DUF3182 family protein [Dokdonella sp.]